MIYCVIGNKGIGCHDLIKKVINKIAEKGDRVNILRKYTLADLNNGHTDFYISISVEEYFDMDAANMFLCKNDYTVPAKTGNKEDIPVTFTEFIKMEDFDKAFESDDPYILECSPKEFSVLWSYMKTHKPREEHYKIYPFFIKSGSEYKRLLGLIDENMSDKDIHLMCNIFLVSYQIDESKMPEGLSVLKENALDYITETINNLEHIIIKLEEWKIIVKTGMLDKVAVSCNLNKKGEF